jgi:hypothetical protein
MIYYNMLTPSTLISYVVDNVFNDLFVYICTCKCAWLLFRDQNELQMVNGSQCVVNTGVTWMSVVVNIHLLYLYARCQLWDYRSYKLAKDMVPNRRKMNLQRMETWRSECCLPCGAQVTAPFWKLLQAPPRLSPLLAGQQSEYIHLL